MINRIEREKAEKKHVRREAGQHLIFKPYVNGQKIKILINNESETKLIDKFYARRFKLDTFKFEKKINLILGNEKTSEKLNETTLIKIDFENHTKKVFCYLIDLKNYTLRRQMITNSQFDHKLKKTIYEF